MHTIVVRCTWAKYLQPNGSEKHNMPVYVNYRERTMRRDKIKDRGIWLKAYKSFMYNSCNFSIIFKVISKLKVVKLFRVVIENIGPGGGPAGLKL